jgi:hypothetical protein
VEIAYTAISLFFGSLFFFFRRVPSQPTGVTTDLWAFVVIIVLAAKSGIKGFRMPSIIRTIIQDATIYFLVIFTSHFVLEMSLLLARVSISIVGVSAMLKFLQPNLQLLPAV